MKNNRLRQIIIMLLTATVSLLLPSNASAESGAYPAAVWILDDEGYWYHYDSNGNMNIGWYLDTDGSWYYLSAAFDDTRGIMQTGWLVDTQDGNWYYLSESGSMVTGWAEIGGYLYYFNENGSEQSGWRWDPASNCWIYKERGQKPLGMLESE
ncbi:MAG: hypothetical protein ACRDBO_08350 [Lachnospiraceae bacterium]